MTGERLLIKKPTMDPKPVTFKDLYEIAKSVVNPRKLSEYADSGGVGAALLSESGAVYTGVCIDTSSSMGFCAEHAAAAAMITAGESRVLKMIAVNWEGRILPPCGRCREFISQLHDDNQEAEVMVAKNVVVTIRELLPYDWRRPIGTR
jgi:cytidine deaminase